LIGGFDIGPLAGDFFVEGYHGVVTAAAEGKRSNQEEEHAKNSFHRNRFYFGR
jgi:hypothetical protein